MAGLPPLSGFLGKLLVLNASFEADLMVWVWAIVLGSSLVSAVGFARAGSVVFWKAHGTPADAPVEGAEQPATLSYVAIGGLFALLVAHTVFAGKVHGYTTAMATELFDHETYMSLVLETPGKLSDYKGGH